MQREANSCTESRLKSARSTPAKLWLLVSAALAISTAPVCYGAVGPLVLSISLQSTNCFLTFTTVSGEQYQVQASPSYAGPFNMIAQMLGTGVPELITFPATAPAQYFRIAQILSNGPPIYSLNEVGYVNQIAQAGSNWVFNPFDNLQVQQALPNPPDGTVLYIWTGNYYSVNSFSIDFGWDVPNQVLPSGGNFILMAPTPFQFAFCGQVAANLFNSPPTITGQPSDQTVYLGPV